MKALKKIEDFTGTEDVERWIDRFEFAVEIDEVKNKEAEIISMYLRGPAYDTWKGLTTEAKKDAARIKQALRRVYGMKRRDAWHAALSHKLINGENLDVAGEEIRKFVKIAVSGTDPVDTVSALLLLDSLPNNVRDQVILQLDVEEKLVYREVLSLAKKMWHGPSQQHLGSYGKTDTTKQRKQCDCCNRFGHERAECMIRCFACGRRGHKRPECLSKPPLNGRGGSDDLDPPKVSN